ncbi:hypothetical protein THASP1DRAFT_30236 [Thamnocephalis sphaerospora]|uniref:Short-chain dehydrogenase/reductase 3 n=1 Tax=Thamnocephalis sphaerospora TaxID=78915 RepID=A0A4V1IWL3_9FUNG|nr:hypothetical protein THASP1DRAFT_30236 [Thamnocephalis sphaerospora]|eukprot:RKP07959.1 hypothetical protein THASP1DRAFT_30236 [Thamnocephalis sphaerospora]
MSTPAAERPSRSTVASPTHPNAFTLDLIVRMLRTTVFHYSFGFVAIIGLKALELPWSHPATQLALGYTALLLVIYGVAHRFRAKETIDWQDQVVVVTGGSGGVGACLSGILAMRGAHVAVLDVEPFASHMPNVKFFPCDVADIEQLHAAAEAIRGDLGHPTVLINNAGCAIKGSILDVEPAQVEKMFRVNSMAHFWTIREFLPDMLRRNEGHIVTVSSILGWCAPAGLSGYGASKAALNVLHDSLHEELRMRGTKVRASLICPGHIGTRLFADLNTANEFLLPVLSPMDIVEAVIEAIGAKQSREYYLPWATNMMPLFNIFPLWMRSYLKELLGVDQSVRHLIPRQPAVHDKEN